MNAAIEAVADVYPTLWDLGLRGRALVCKRLPNSRWNKTSVPVGKRSASYV